MDSSTLILVIAAIVVAYGIYSFIVKKILLGVVLVGLAVVFGPTLYAWLKN